MKLIIYIIIKIGMIRFSQSNTEWVVKTIRKTDPSFTAYNEIKEKEGKRDRAGEEVFLRENRVPIGELPLEELNQEWLKTHRAALKTKSKKDVAIQNYLKNDISKIKFWTA